MNKYLLLFVLSVLLWSCKNKKVSLAGNDDGELSAPEFMEYFQALKLPYMVTDTILRRIASVSSPDHRLAADLC